MKFAIVVKDTDTGERAAWTEALRILRDNWSKQADISGSPAPPAGYAEALRHKTAVDYAASVLRESGDDLR